MSESFRALVVSESQGTNSAELRRLTDEDLPNGDVTVVVEFSSLNFKDGLAITGRGRVVRRLVTTVMPFILRGVNLLGIDSNTCPHERRLRAWQRIAGELPGETIDRLTTTIALEDVARVAEDILAGRVHGRTVVALAS